MPKGRYTVGARGTHGCSGYPVVGDTGKVHGCHKTRASARAQQAAIYTSTAKDNSYDVDSAKLCSKR
jgi:predicted NBD/HSP70 family sugar kinase